MLLKATFKNILSFEKETVIDFKSGNSKLLPEQISKDRRRDTIPVLKTSLIFGPNGSGKSNFCKCIECIQKIALGNFDSTYLTPFKLSTDGKEKFSYIEVEFKAKDKYYRYGVNFNGSGIAEETLTRFNKRSSQIIFERKKEDESYSYKFEPLHLYENEKQFLLFIADGTPINNSFLHEYKIRNGKGLSDINDVNEWFETSLHIIFPQSRFRNLPLALSQDPDFTKKLCLLMKYFNTGVDEIKLKEVKSEEAHIRQIERDRINSDLKKNPGAIIAVSTLRTLYVFQMVNGAITCKQEVTIHKKANGDTVAFDLSEESDGTLRLLDILPMLIDLKENDSVYIIDEIDRSMHPALTKSLLGLYFKLIGENRDTQMICTTHEAYLMEEKKLRPDQFWFVRKKNGASTFFRMEKKRIRNILSKSYLNGEIGGLPSFDTNFLHLFQQDSSPAPSQTN